MKFAVSCKGLSLTSEMREHVDRRLTYSLSRFGPQIASIRVYLTDENGPRGGRDKLCLVVIDMRGAREVVITQRSESLTQAINAAAMRAGRTVARIVKRGRGRGDGRVRRESAPLRASPRFRSRRRHRPLERSGRSRRWR